MSTPTVPRGSATSTPPVSLAVRGESHVARSSTLERCKEGDGKSAEVASMATEQDFPSLTQQRSSVLDRSSDFHHGLLGGAS